MRPSTVLLLAAIGQIVVMVSIGPLVLWAYMAGKKAGYEGTR